MRKAKVRHVVLITALFGSAVVAPGANSPEFFETRIRPVLDANCLGCHAKLAMAGLRLDSRAAMLKGGATGPAVIPGEPDKSLLIKAIRQETPDLQMPKGGKLKKREIDDFVEWVKAGAVWPEAKMTVASGPGLSAQQRAFWSFRPLKNPTPPEPKSRTWARNAIDKFLLAAMEREGLTPGKPADKRTLMRRVTLDLTGLPPKPEEVEAFVADTSADAYPKLIDRLLASPAYGERWGRHWLDVVRYGEDDTRGLAPQNRGYMPYPFAYLYRDWVIQAMNDDLPYGDFVKAQIAGDLLDEKLRVKMLPATGFLGLGPWYYDLADPPVARSDERHERIDTTTRAFLGLTVGCARCHDHKYDPISIKDYYSLAGVFGSTTYKEYPQVPKGAREEYEAKEKKLEDKQKLMGEFLRSASEQMALMYARRAADYMLGVFRMKGEVKKPLHEVAEQLKLDAELLARWDRFLAKPPAFYPYLKPWQEMMAKGGTDEEQAKKLAREFQDVLNAVIVEHREFDKENEIIKAKALPGTKPKPEPKGKPHEFETADDFCPGCGLELRTMAADRGNLFTDVFLYDVHDTDPAPQGRKTPALLSFRGFGLEKRLSAEAAQHLADMRAEMEKDRKELEPELPLIHGVAESPKIGNQPLLKRGNPYAPDAEIPRGFPEVLTPEPKRFEKGSGRLDLAETIAAHPLTARVIVNRIWKWHFGTGIVNTPSNFGQVGERPVHPELLEHLASWFTANGMSFKKLHREILLSAAYQLSAADIPANTLKDPENRYYWRGNRRRLEAEAIRDSMLAVSGTLDTRMFGPSEVLAAESKRRTLYGKVSRFRLDPYLQLFDFPNPGLSAEQRHITSVPPQKLFFLNSDFVLKQAEGLVNRLDGEAGDDAKVRLAYRLLYQRAPSADETAAAVAFLAEERKKERAAPQESAPDKNDKNDKKKTPAPAPWVRYARVLFSTNEFLEIQ